MTYRPLERLELENFLRVNTTYDINLLFKTKSINQIASMCRSIESAMQRYPREISEYYKANPNIEPFVPDSVLQSMNYNELVDLRKKLGIKNTKKKVVRQEEATDVAQLSIDFIQSEQANHLCVSIMQSNSENEDLQILTSEEIREMYGGEELSKEDLARRGIVSDKVDEPEKVDPEDERIEMIDEIISSKITIANQILDINFLYTLGEAELKTLYEITKNFIMNNRKERSLKK